MRAGILRRRLARSVSRSTQGAWVFYGPGHPCMGPAAGCVQVIVGTV